MESNEFSNTGIKGLWYFQAFFRPVVSTILTQQKFTLSKNEMTKKLIEVTNKIKHLIRDYWFMQRPVSMPAMQKPVSIYVTLQCHIDIMMIIAIHCDSLCTNCQLRKTGHIDHIGVLQILMEK